MFAARLGNTGNRDQITPRIAFPLASLARMRCCRCESMNIHPLSFSEEGLFGGGGRN
jgi:hypothetical protein